MAMRLASDTDALQFALGVRDEIDCLNMFGSFDGRAQFFFAPAFRFGGGGGG